MGKSRSALAKVEQNFHKLTDYATMD